MKIKYKCQICNNIYTAAGLSRHIKSIHNFKTYKEYYDIYIKTEFEGICPICSKETKFNHNKYREFCSPKCASIGSVDKIKATKLEIYGNENYVNHEKAKLTNFKKYNVENPFQSNIVKEKIKQTNLIKYGVDNPAKSIIIKEKTKDTCIKKYGVESTNQLEIVKEKKKETSLQHYGVDNPNKCASIIEKRINTRIKKYGSYIDETIKTKMFTTNYERYGCKTYSQTLEFNNRIHFKRSQYKYNSIHFDSSYELAYYIWLNDHNINFEYHPNIFFTYMTEDSKLHRYFPDFKVNNEYIELKGKHLITDNNILINPRTKQLLFEKTQCLKDNNVKIITDCSEYLNYIIENYGKHYLKQFKM